MLTLRKILLLFSRPGAFIALVGVMVLCGGIFLWRGMAVPPIKTAAHPPGVQRGTAMAAAVGDGPRDAASQALRGMVDLAFEEPFGHLEDADKQADFDLFQTVIHWKS